MSLLLISQAYSFSDDGEEIAETFKAKEKQNESFKNSGRSLTSIVNLKCRTSLRLVKQNGTGEKYENLDRIEENKKIVLFKETNGTDRGDLRKTRKKLVECSSRLNKLNAKAQEKDEMELESEDEVFTSSFFDLLDQMETKHFIAEKNPRKQLPINSQQRKTLALNQCIMCLKQLGSCGDLQRHILTHTGEKPFSCNFCNSSFTQLSNLKFHKLTHTGEKAYKCMVCYKSFTKSSNLKEHKRIHTGEKPFHCSVCCMQFKQSSSLKRHQRIHTGEKPYECTICMNFFVNFNNLKRHENIHTKQKRFECLSCGATFSRRDTLQRHNQRLCKINH